MAHGEDLRHECQNDALVAQLTLAPLQANVSEQDHALLTYAEKLTRRPADITEHDLAPLRAAGFDDRAIHDAAQVIALFNYYNRIADGLGVTLSDDGPAAS